MCVAGAITHIQPKRNNSKSSGGGGWKQHEGEIGQNLKKGGVGGGQAI